VLLLEDVPATLFPEQEYVSPSMLLVSCIVRVCVVTMPLLSPLVSDTGAALVMTLWLCSHVIEAAGLELPVIHVRTKGRPATTVSGFTDRTAVVGLTGVIKP